MEGCGCGKIKSDYGSFDGKVATLRMRPRNQSDFNDLHGIRSGDIINGFSGFGINAAILHTRAGV